MDWSLSKLIRIEAGSVGISTNDLKALLRHYQLDDPDLTSELVALARAARERSWWSVYRDVAPVRMRRQEQLDRDDPPLLFFILDEAVVRRLIGGRDVMRRQIHHLIEMAARPNVTIEIVPFSAGSHPGLTGPFVIVEFPDPGDDDVLFLEARGDMIRAGISEEGEALAHREVFEQLRQLSLGPDGSIAYLGKLADEMT